MEYILARIYSGWNIFWVEYILSGIYILVGIYSGWREGEKMLTLHSQPLQQALGCYLHFRTLAAPSGWDRPHRSTVTLGLQRPEWNRRRCHANHEWWKDVGTAVEGRGGWGAPISQSQGSLIMPGGVGGLTQLSPGWPTAGGYRYVGLHIGTDLMKAPPENRLMYK